MKLLKSIFKNVMHNRLIYSVIVTFLNIFLYIFRFSIYRSITSFISSITDTYTIDTIGIELCIFFVKLVTVQLLHSYTYYLLETSVISGVKTIFQQIVRKMLDYRIEFYKKNNTHKISQLWFYISSVEMLMEKILLEVPRIIAFLCYYMYTIYSFSLNALLIVIPFNFICIRMLHPLSKKLYLFQDKRTKLDIMTKNKLLETTSNIEHVKLCNQQTNEKEKIINLYEKYYRNKVDDKRISSQLTFWSEIISDILLVLTYFIGCHYILNGTMKPMEIMYLAVHTGSFYYNISQIKDIYNFYNKIKSKVQIVYDVLNYDKNELIDELPQLDNTKWSKSYIAFDNISYKYDDADTYVLNNVNFYFKKNRINLLLGPNGCGKSTIIKLLLKLHEPTSGQIVYYGKHLTTKNIRDNFILVSQEPHIFDDTVWNNIIYGLDKLTPSETIQKVMEVCRLLDSEKWLEVNGNKECGFRGKNLSGGEKKKIQLLNTMCRDADTIIFDEPSNALDSSAIEWYMNFVRQLCSKLNKTVIIITHDLRLVNLSEHTVDMHKIDLPTITLSP